MMECKGLFFRGARSTYLSQHGSFEERTSLRKLKSHSCPGCEICEDVMDIIRESGIINDCFNFSNIQYGKKYKLNISCSGGEGDGFYCHDTTEIDHLEFNEVPE